MNFLASFHNDPFDDSVAFAHTMLNNMGQMITAMRKKLNFIYLDAPNGHEVSSSSSTLMSMDGHNPEQPRIIQATCETLRGPEGLERTGEAVRDTGQKMEKMEIAHRLGERDHCITRERDPTSGELLESRILDHIENEDEFEREWFDQAEKVGLKNLYGSGFNAFESILLEAPSTDRHLRSPSQQPSHLAVEQFPTSTSHSL